MKTAGRNSKPDKRTAAHGAGFCSAGSGISGFGLALTGSACQRFVGRPM